MKTNPWRLTSSRCASSTSPVRRSTSWSPAPSLYDPSTGPPRFGSNCDVGEENRSSPKIVRPLSGGATVFPSLDLQLTCGPRTPGRLASSVTESGRGSTGATATVSHVIVGRGGPSGTGGEGLRPTPWSSESGATERARSAAITEADGTESVPAAPDGWRYESSRLS